MKSDLKNKIDNILLFIANNQNDFVDNEIKIEAVIKAFEILEKNNLSSNNDCFNYFASLNLINAYVKKTYAVNNLKDNYKFKKYIIIALNQLTKYCPDGVNFGQGDGKVIYLSIYNLQFSFHSALPKECNLSMPSTEWKGVKLQPFANYIFNYVE